MHSIANVCLTGDSGLPLKTYINNDTTDMVRPFVRLINKQSKILLPQQSYRLPLTLALEDKTCFNKPFCLLGANDEYFWFNLRGEKLFDVYWFDNGPDYPSDGLLRFKQNELIGYADANTLATVILANFKAAYPFEKSSTIVAYDASTTITDGEHLARQQSFKQDNHYDKQDHVFRE